MSSFNFDLKTTAINTAIKWEKLLLFRFVPYLRKILLVVFIALFLFFGYNFIKIALDQSTLSLLLGLSIISLVLSLALWYEELFVELKLDRPYIEIKIGEVIEAPQKYNLASFLAFNSARAVAKAIKFSRKKKTGEVNSTMLLYYLLSGNDRLDFIFSRILIDLKNVKKVIKTYLSELKSGSKKTNGLKYSKDFQEAVTESFKVAERKGHNRIREGDMITALAKHDLLFRKILMDSKIKASDIENLTWWLESLRERVDEDKKFWKWENLLKRGNLARTWASGYTITLDRFGVDFSEAIKKRGFQEVVSHQKEIKMVERILSRREINNCLIVGEPGVGRKNIVLALAQRSLLGQGLPEVNYKRIIQLDLTSVAAQTETVAEAEVVLDRIFQEAVSAGNVILLINEFHNFIGGIDRPGIVDVSGIISPYLNLPQFQIVATTSFAGLHKNIEQKPAILSLFEKVEVSEPSERETFWILEELALILERKYKRFITFPALREVISMAKRYLPAVPFPKSAINLLDELMVNVSSTKEKIVLPEHVAQLVSEKTEIPVGDVQVQEREVLLNLENLLHKRIINQQEAVKEVSTALRRARADITIRKGPMGTFLFLGPTGVGKTETAKALNEIYFGSGRQSDELRSSSRYASAREMIRLDMSEFQNTSDIPRLLGSVTEEGFLTTQVRENPFSMVLLDEIEKAHPNVLNLFLQVLDEGHLTDGLGRKVDFKNTIIIATSNAGYKIILKALKENEEWSLVKDELLDFLFQEGTFRPEFINRFDAVVIFQPLSKENLLDIAEIMLQKLKRNLQEKDIEFIITLPLKKKIVELGYNPTFGAREMRRVIQDKVENVLASALLAGQIKRGDKAEIDSDFQLKINV
ncbi:MAG: ATP-dependent Clp protease ATP-binding subunit [bacterium]|nr:ATP-dependent Clp protease ATP-binding subunit [bacterium]